MATASDRVWPAHHRIAGFELVAALRDSDSGILYRAWDPALARPVLLEEFLPIALAQRDGDGVVQPALPAAAALLDRARRRFVEESRRLARADHPALARVLQLVEAHGTLFRVMPGYTGEPLADLMARDEAPHDERMLRRLLDDTLGALDAWHAVAGPHGGVRPTQILCLDNGRALLLGPDAVSLTPLGSGGWPGAAPPASPALQDGGAPDGEQGIADDLLALARVVRACMLDGVPVEPGLSLPAALARRAGAGSPPVETYSAALVQALDGALSSDPLRRPKSAAQMAQWLQCTGQALPPGGPGAPESAIARAADPAGSAPDAALASASASASASGWAAPVPAGPPDAAPAQRAGPVAATMASPLPPAQARPVPDAAPAAPAAPAGHATSAAPTTPAPVPAPSSDAPAARVVPSFAATGSSGSAAGSASSSTADRAPTGESRPSAAPASTGGRAPPDDAEVDPVVSALIRSVVDAIPDRPANPDRVVRESPGSPRAASAEHPAEPGLQAFPRDVGFDRPAFAADPRRLPRHVVPFRQRLVGLGIGLGALLVVGASLAWWWQSGRDPEQAASSADRTAIAAAGSQSAVPGGVAGPSADAPRAGTEPPQAGAPSGGTDRPTAATSAADTSAPAPSGATAPAPAPGVDAATAGPAVTPADGAAVPSTATPVAPSAATAARGSDTAAAPREFVEALPAVRQPATAPRQGGPAAAAPGNPRQQCGARTEFALYRCMQQQCAQARWRSHPQCTVLRDSDRVPG